MTWVVRQSGIGNPRGVGCGVGGCGAMDPPLDLESCCMDPSPENT